MSGGIPAGGASISIIARDGDGILIPKSVMDQAVGLHSGIFFVANLVTF
jgi:hypothetical protein